MIAAPFSGVALIITIVVTVFGLAIGSFLNVVIYRVPRDLSVVSPPSACPGCSNEIAARDNVPLLSWLALRGKCRHCGMKISARYPLVEVITALLFLAVALGFSPAIDASPTTLDLAANIVILVAFLYLMGISVALTAIDLELKRLPNRIVYPSYAVGVPLLLIAAALSGEWETFARAAAGAGILFAFYFIVAFISPRGMGIGDVKLAGIVGLYLGWLGWDHLLVGAFAAFLIGGIVSVVLLIVGKAGRKTAIPFGPWMLTGAWVGIFAGHGIARGYLSLAGLN